MLTPDSLQEIMEGLENIENDSSVPKNVKAKIRNTIVILTNEQEKNTEIKVDRSIQELGDVAEDPNIPSHTRMQIWSVLSLLESK